MFVVGMILWELYHSQRPFDGMLHAQVIAHVALKNVGCSLPSAPPPSSLPLWTPPPPPLACHMALFPKAIP